MSSPGVSVVLPTHSRSGTLGAAVRSVLAQTFADLELIVVDDGSTDDTAALMASFDDPRLVYVHMAERRGAAVARNTGIRRARADLIAFQDSDDEWLASKLEDQLAVFHRSGPGLGAVGGRYSIQAGTVSEQVTAPHLEAGRDYEAELLEGPCCITPVWLIRRPVLDELGLFDERMPCLEDWDLMLRLSERTAMCAVAKEVLVKRGAADSLGADLSRRAPAMEELLRRHGHRFLAHPRRHASFCLELAYLCLLQGQAGRALRYGARSLRRRGASARMLVAFARACVNARAFGRPTWPVPGLVDDR
jgi:glycosyltransferase involved in cell wall biosynthesis